MAFARSSAFFDRISTNRKYSPLLPLHEKHRKSDEYDLQELPPDVEDALLSENDARKNRLTFRSPSPMDPWEEPASSAGSSSKLKGRGHFFRGPPPPIAASIMVHEPSKPSADSRGRLPAKSTKNPIQSTLGSVFFDSPWQRPSSHTTDSVWRSLQRREKIIGKDLQNLLDMQASSLVAGSGPPSSSATSEHNAFSDDGSSTPTATFYSTVTSKSRMMATLDDPPRANARGNVIPVRQPKSSKPRGLRAARSGLSQAMSALTDIKREEDSHLKMAISDRKKALSQIKRLAAKQEGISGELEALSDNSDEPLAKELRDLGTQHQTLDAEIRELEERLVGMRNRRRWLERKMEDVGSRREAGLSGYRGALREVQGELNSLVRRPRIEPLDLEALSQNLEDGQSGISPPETFMTGEDFLQLIPERRTTEMAVEWWEGEVHILEARRKQVDKERDALEAGSQLWRKSIKLVGDFEAGLRSLMSGGSKGKNKDGVPPIEEVMQAQLSHMADVIQELDSYLKEAEANNWNLLICAIGAELEAFQEAESVLRRNLGMEVSQASTSPHEEVQHQQLQQGEGTTTSQPIKNDYPPSESDNEVPPDLLGADDDHDQQHEPDSNPTSKRPPPTLRRESSSNDPPPEFLAEHDPDSDA